MRSLLRLMSLVNLSCLDATQARSIFPRRYMPIDLGVQFGVGCKPKWQQKVVKASNADTMGNCGEDAYYMSENKTYISFGVADGINRWSQYGIPGEGGHESAFANALCVGARNAFLEGIHTPLDLMRQGYDHVVKGGDENAGSSTAVILALNRFTGRLESANLGNSGYVVIRNGKLLIRSKTQIYRALGANIPFQLSLFPSAMKHIGANKLNHMFGPDDSYVTSITVEPGDVIIVGSGGLFANMFEDDILFTYKIVLDRFYKKHPAYYADLKAWLAGTSTRPPTKGVSLIDLRSAMRELSFTLSWMADNRIYEKSRAQTADHQNEFMEMSDITAVAVYVHADPNEG